MLSLQEDYQAVLYYIGKFRIENLKMFLTDIIENQDTYHPTYFRTVSLSLSSIGETTTFCDDYVLNIANNFINNQNGKLFCENIYIQKKYHGASPKKLRAKLQTNLDNYINQSNIESNITLIVFTYFTTFVLSEKEINPFKKELSEIRNVANNSNFKALVNICDIIPSIWKKMLDENEENICY